MIRNRSNISEYLIPGKTTMYYQLQFLKEKITGVVIKGLATVERAVISMDDSKGGKPQ